MSSYAYLPPPVVMEFHFNSKIIRERLVFEAQLPGPVFMLVLPPGGAMTVVLHHIILTFRQCLSLRDQPPAYVSSQLRMHTFLVSRFLSVDEMMKCH